MGANIWNPGGNTFVDAENSFLSQVFTAVGGQTVFNLTTFSYVPNSGSIAIFRGGQKLVSGVDYTETSDTVFTLLITDLAAGEVIEAVAIIGSTSANAAAASNSAAAALASKEAAAISETNAAASAAAAAHPWAVEAGGIGYTGGNVRMAGTLVQGSATGWRNKVINGDCRVAQRSAASIINNAWQFGAVDRILFAPVGFTTATGTILQGTDIGVQGTCGCVVSITTTGSGALAWQTRLEAADVACLNGKTVTASVKVNQNTGADKNAVLRILKANAKDNFSNQTILASGAVTTATNNGISAVSVTYQLGASDASNGLVVQLEVQGVGALSSNGNVAWDFALEEGSVVTPFEHRPYQVELAMCQRYFYKTFEGAIGTPPGDNGAVFSNINSSAGNIDNVVATKYPVQMRSTPTITTVNPTQTWGNGNWRSSSDTIDCTSEIHNNSSFGCGIKIVGQPPSQWARIQFYASAEL